MQLGTDFCKILTKGIVNHSEVKDIIFVNNNEQCQYININIFMLAAGPYMDLGREGANRYSGMCIQISSIRLPYRVYR